MMRLSKAGETGRADSLTAPAALPYLFTRRLRVNADAKPLTDYQLATFVRAMRMFRGAERGEA